MTKPDKPRQDMLHNKSWVISLIFIALDAAVLYAVFQLAAALRVSFSSLLGRPLARWDLLWTTAIPMGGMGFFLVVAMFLLQGLYPGYGLTAVKELEKMSRATTLAFILLSAFSYIYKPFQSISRAMPLLAWSLAILVLPLARFGARNLLSRSKWYGIPVVVFGEDEWAREVTKSLKRVRRLGWRPVESLPMQDFDSEKNYRANNLALVVSPPEARTGELVRRLNQRFRNVVLLRLTDNFGALWAEARDLDGFLGLEFHYHLLARHNLWLKRGMDILGSSILLLLLSPLLALIALLIVLDSPGPVFYRQERLGRGFRRFRVFKFRSMLANAEEKLKQLLAEDPRARAEYEEYHKLENDPRVTKLGDFLRKYSLDELPQLLNVLKGEMSLVGPRAYMPAELDEMGGYAPIILRVNPGISGWWQIFGRHNTGFKKRLQMDEYYISNWSPWMDIYILMKTIPVVLRGSGV